MTDLDANDTWLLLASSDRVLRVHHDFDRLFAWAVAPESMQFCREIFIVN